MTRVFLLVYIHDSSTCMPGSQGVFEPIFSKIGGERANEVVNRSNVQFVTHSDLMEFVTHSHVRDKCMKCMKSTQRRIITVDDVEFVEDVEFVTRYSYIRRVPQMYQELTMQRIITVEYVQFVTLHI